MRQHAAKRPTDPNGSGKSTTLNLVSGVLAPSDDGVTRRGPPITGLAANEIARRVARTCQCVRLLPSMTVLGGPRRAGTLSSGRHRAVSVPRTVALRHRCTGHAVARRVVSARTSAAAPAAGTAVVLRPSEDTPGAGGTGFAEALDEAGIPKGVFNVVTCSRDRLGAAGDERIEDPTVNSTTEIRHDKASGPVVIVVPIRIEEEAIALNDVTEDGLIAALGSRDGARAQRMAERVETGICHVNCPTINDEPPAPFGGEKASGSGCHAGCWALAAVTEPEADPSDRGGCRFPPAFRETTQLERTGPDHPPGRHRGPARRARPGRQARHQRGEPGQDRHRRAQGRHRRRHAGDGFFR